MGTSLIICNGAPEFKTRQTHPSVSRDLQTEITYCFRRKDDRASSARRYCSIVSGNAVACAAVRAIRSKPATSSVTKRNHDGLHHAALLCNKLERTQWLYLRRFVPEVRSFGLSPEIYRLASKVRNRSGPGPSVTSDQLRQSDTNGD
jgi:hypothetical protein